MTREEAAIILEGFKNNPLFNDTHVQAIDMAISALSEKEWKFYYDHGYAQAKRDLSENEGEWERVSGGSLIDVYRCSKCKHEPPKKPIPDRHTWGWDFTDICPNCEARMKGEKMNRYLCRATKTKWIEAENEQEALEKFKDVKEDIKIRCVGEAPTEFQRRAALSQGEASYLDQGITPGIV